MAATVVQIGEALKTAIAAALPTWTVVRGYLPPSQLSEFAEGRISVIHPATTGNPELNGRDKKVGRVHEINVGVWKLVSGGASNTDALDSLALVTESLIDLVLAEERATLILDSGQRVGRTAWENDPAINFEALHESDLYVSIIKVFYTERR